MTPYLWVESKSSNVLFCDSWKQISLIWSLGKTLFIFVPRTCYVILVMFEYKKKCFVKSTQEPPKRFLLQNCQSLKIPNPSILELGDKEIFQIYFFTKLWSAFFYTRLRTKYDSPLRTTANILFRTIDLHFGIWTALRPTRFPPVHQFKDLEDLSTWLTVTCIILLNHTKIINIIDFLLNLPKIRKICNSTILNQV